MKLALSGHGDRFFDITVEEVREHNPQLISAVVEIDLMTFSEVTWSRYTAGLMLRHGRTFLLRPTVRVAPVNLRSWAEPSVQSSSPCRFDLMARQRSWHIL